MSTRHLQVIAEVSEFLNEDAFWKSYLKKFSSSSKNSPSVHLAIMVEPFLTYVLDGSKTIESRFSVNRCAPFKRVKKGDIILLKKSGGPITGICLADYAWFYQLDENSWQDIKTNFSKQLCADKSFWESRQRASYATLIRVINVKSVDPIYFEKKDRRGWVVLSDNSESQPLLKNLL
jgi:ASC-1-like (ASCH) protein